MAAGGGVVAAVGLGAGIMAVANADEVTDTVTDEVTESASASSSSSSATECYSLTSETTEGPYYIDADKIRKDITEGKAGIPLTLRLTVIDNVTCDPIADAAVDVWQCDALGIYSGYEAESTGGGGGGGDAPTGEPPTDAPTGEPPTGEPGEGGGGGPAKTDPSDDERYLRGTLQTDADGVVEFTSIFPGWYQGRCVHIHTKVHVNGTWTDAGYDGGNTCHTGQFFFDEETVIATMAVDPYSTSTTPRTTLEEDGIYPQNGTQGGLLAVKYDTADIAAGVVATITMGVDPDETNEGSI